MDGSKDYSKLPNTCVFTMKQFETNRKFSNLFGPEISAVKQRVEFFVKNSKWYDLKGIPHTLGLLLSGQAGAGKTSSIKCLANETKRHIININLNNDITKVQLDNLFFNETLFVINPSTNKTETYYIPLNQRIYVLEDIDCQDKIVVNRESKEDLLKGHNNSNDRKPLQQPAQQPLPIGIAEKIDLSFLLNLLDGILETPGRIVIMTSNHPEKLDHALIRPGRIDIIANFKKCTRETIFQMMEHFYDVLLQSDVQKIIFDEFDDYFISPAEMSKLMFENITDYRAALVELKKYYVNTLNKKEDLLPNNMVVKEEQAVLPDFTGYQDTTFDLCEKF
jgi:chaperone BCS1